MMQDQPDPVPVTRHLPSGVSDQTGSSHMASSRPAGIRAGKPPPRVPVPGHERFFLPA